MNVCIKNIKRFQHGVKTIEIVTLGNLDEFLNKPFCLSEELDNVIFLTDEKMTLLRALPQIQFCSF